jgi:pyruvate dehydrogenase E2 component (dihydrolipoamide acetyltransferase)
MTVFKLPDLGEGLPDAEIVEWLVTEGEEVKLDQPLVSMETAKAVVEVPSPVTGRVVRFHGQAGDVIQTGAPLVDFAVEGEALSAEVDATSDGESATQSGQDAVDDDAPAGAVLEDLDLQPPLEESQGPDELYDEFGASGIETSDFEAEPEPEPEPEPEIEALQSAQTEDGPASDDGSRAEPEDDVAAEAPISPEEPGQDSEDSPDSGTVVGNVQSGNEVLQEHTSDLGGVRVTPAVRALARKLRVDIRQVRPSGTGNVVTAADVRQAASDGSAPLRALGSGAPSAPEEPVVQKPQTPAEQPDQAEGTEADQWVPVRGPRRTMARVMTESHRSIVPTTLMDDADIHAWRPGEDLTARLIRALWAGALVEPGLNAWYDGENGLRMVHKNMHVGMAVDTEDGLFVAALRDVNQLDRRALRSEINRLRDNAASRSIPPEDLKDYTIILSNFGKFAGRYATPVITPPCVCIVAAGALRHEVVPVLGGIEVHRMIPLSLTFDHRACTGGEAARFLKAMLEDLAKPE